MVDDNDINRVYGLVISKERETNKKYNIDDMNNDGVVLHHFWDNV